MSEKDLEQFNADVQENEAAAAAPVDNASPEAIGEAIKEINGEADASAAPEKADDELQVGVIKPIATGKPESKRALKKAEKKKAKELKNIYHVSNWQIIKNYRNYNSRKESTTSTSSEEELPKRYGLFSVSLSCSVWDS